MLGKRTARCIDRGKLEIVICEMEIRLRLLLRRQLITPWRFISPEIGGSTLSHSIYDAISCHH